MHRHAHATEQAPLPPEIRTKVARALACIVVPLALATLIGLVMLWPRGESIIGSLPASSGTSQEVSGVITHVGKTSDIGETDVRMSVDGIEVPLHVSAEIVASGMAVGDHVKARFTPQPSGTALPSSPSQPSAIPSYIFADYERSSPLLILTILYIVVIVSVARVKGLAALGGLSLSLLVVGFFMIPALASGENAMWVILTGASAMMFASIYLAHGISIRTTTAVIGTFCGLVITAALATWAVGAQNLSGAVGEESIQLSWTLGGLNMRSLLLAGMVLAGLGALNDVTITQVSTIWELHAESPSTPRRRLFMRGMAVGRDHIASTVYTLAFAYVGASLPLLILASMYDRPVLDLVQLELIAEEITRTLTTSIGLVLAIPLTTAVAAMLASVAPTRARKTT
ncbi:YibE/F family protein [Actinotignum urinale]|uniref:YibE/F family protein n=1 Tax=Actinotignum urinale TaxID=190146 RepID=UPI0003B703C6|nr:YibE/F family protein [Actinotignum urinale]MDY5160823.1 YibE/F family protein [Actinotignum urinale]WIK59177.1 YibE/F family protein [Actinotignum urinale]